MLIIEKWPKSSSKTPKIMSRRPQRRLSARRLGVMFPRRRCRVKAPSPLSPAVARHMLILPASPIALVAMSRRPVPPTRARPTRPTGSIFRRSAGAPIWPHCPRIRKPSDFTSQLALPARLNAVQKRTLSRPSNAASPHSPGTMPSVASRSIARTGISPP